MEGLQRLMGLLRGRHLERGPPLQGRLVQRDLELGAGVGYENFRDERHEMLGRRSQRLQAQHRRMGGLDASIKHKPTGLFPFALSVSSDTTTNGITLLASIPAREPPDMNAWDVRGGIQRKIGGVRLGAAGRHLASSAAIPRSTTVFGGALRCPTRRPEGGHLRRPRHPDRDHRLAKVIAGSSPSTRRLTPRPCIFTRPISTSPPILIW